MSGGVLLMIFVFSTLQAGSQNEIDPDASPRILHKTSSTKIVNAGDTFQLECESDDIVHWSYPQLSFDLEELMFDDMTEVNITHYSLSTGNYRSVIQVINSNYLDTGYYSCIINGTSGLEQEHVSEIYIYVKDPNKLLVGIEHDMVIRVATQHEPAVLPCRTTSPDVNVTLYRDGDLIPVGYSETYYINVTFDSKIGFILDPIDVIHSGTYDCNASKEDVTETMTCVLDVMKKTNSIPKPSINDSSVNRVTAGETLYLECIGMVTHGIKYTIEWIIPNKSNRTNISEPVPHKNCGKNTYTCHMSSLTIKDVKLKDAGNYTCVVRDHNGITNSDSQMIKIHEPGENYINLTYDTLEIDVSAHKPNVTWVIKVDASPQPSFKWFSPDGEITQNNMKYNMTVGKNSQRVILTINSIEIKDAGAYSFQAISGKFFKELNLTLVVKDKPVVQLKNDELYYQLGKNYSMECKVVGHPAPTIEWFYCPLDCSNGSFIMIEDVSEIVSDINVYISNLVWEVKEPGQLQCFARNSEGEGNDIASIIVTDIPEKRGFGIWGKSEKVVAGDTIKLHCAAAKYNYSEDIVWYERRPGYEKYFLMQNKSDVQYIIRNDTQYSYKLDLTLINVTLGSDADYKCTAKRNDDGVTEEREEIIKVLAEKEPRILESNMTGTDLMINTGNRVDFFCKPYGLPVPTVKWYKDDKPLVRNSTRITIMREKLLIPFANFDDEGTYKCEVSNRLGSVHAHLNLKFRDKPGLNIILVIGITVCGIVLLILIIVLLMRIRREKKLREELNVAGLSNFVQGAMESINPELPVDDQAELLPYDKKWEFPREKLKLGKQLGAGAFGVVMKAEAWGILEGEMKSTVAVKMVKRNADHTYIKALASELKIMIHLGKHLNVVNLLGASTKNLAKMELLVIVEYCRFGNLHNYLLRHREEFVDQIDQKTGEIDSTIGLEILSRTESVRSKSKLRYASLSFSSSSGGRSSSGDMPVDYRAACAAHSGDQSPDPTGVDTEMNLISMTPTGEHDEFVLSNNSIQPEWRSNYRGDYKGARPICTRDLLCWAFQVARGMEYLASRKVMHGDLAARNILLADDNIVKICDFGLAKSMYKSDNYRKKGDGPLPVKWMAIESIRDRVFSTQSDVWSFGIVLWEFFSLARTPYPGMEADEKLYNKLVDGYRMEKPEHCTVDIYNVMQKCWESHPARRPSFTDLSEKLGNMLEDSVRRHYIDLNDPYMDMNAQWLQGLDNDYLSMMNAPTYGNMVSPSCEENDHEYVNSPSSEVTSDGGEHSGYLCMKSPTPEENIFSPRKKEGTVFRFSPLLQNQGRQRNVKLEEADRREQKPMLSTNRNSSESDIELDELEKGSRSKERIQSDRRGEGISELPSFSNPTYQSIIPITPSADNYVNMPQQKVSKYEKMRNPSESHSTNTEFSERFPSPIDMSTGEQFELSSKNPSYGKEFQNSFSNPNYQSQLKPSTDMYVNLPSHNRRTSDASSGIQSDVGDSLLVS